MPCLPTCRGRPRSEARRTSLRAQGAQFNPPLCGVWHRSDELGRDVTPKELLGFPQALTVRSWTEDDEGVRPMYAVVTGPHEEVRAGGEPNREDSQGTKHDCRASCHDGRCR